MVQGPVAELIDPNTGIRSDEYHAIDIPLHDLAGVIRQLDGEDDGDDVEVNFCLEDLDELVLELDDEDVNIESDWI